MCGTLNQLNFDLMIMELIVLSEKSTAIYICSFCTLVPALGPNDQSVSEADKAHVRTTARDSMRAAWLSIKASQVEEIKDLHTYLFFLRFFSFFNAINFANADDFIHETVGQKSAESSFRSIDFLGNNLDERT